MIDPEELCQTCPKRPVCSCLCPEAEYYADQDEVPQREITIGLPRHGKWPEPVEKSRFTRRETEVMRLLANGKSREDISKILGVSRKNVKEVIRHIRRKRNDKERV